MSIENIVKMAVKRFYEYGTDYYSRKGLETAIKASIERKAKLNSILGLNESNSFTLTMPIEASESDIRSSFSSTNSLVERLLYFLHSNVPKFSFKENYIQKKSGKIKMTRFLSKYEEFLKSSEMFKLALTELSNGGAMKTETFQDFVCRIGELKDSGGNELFITSSIAEMWAVNWKSAYRSCLRHKQETDTSYFTGTSAFGMDDFTLLVGIRRKHDKYKLGRSWIHVFPDGIDSADTDHQTPFMIQPKSYGEFNDMLRKSVRETIQKHINIYTSTPSEWVTDRSDSITEEHHHGYIDNYDWQLAYQKKSLVSKPTGLRVYFSKEVPCVKCGKIVTTATKGSSLCDDCQNEYYCKCQECHDIIYSSADAHHVEDIGNLCTSCYSARFFTCACCGVQHDADSAVNALVNGRIRKICNSCFEKEFEACDLCNNAYNKSNIVDSIEGNRICESCAEGYCDGCGKFFEPNSESFDHEDGSSLCSACEALQAQAA